MIAHERAVLVEFESQLRELINQHLEMDGDLLGLAVAFVPQSKDQDLYLIEVLEKPGWPGKGYTMENRTELSETEIGSTRGFPMPPDMRLHLIVTNPVEFQEAIKHDWPMARLFRKSLMSDRHVVLHVKPDYEGYLDRLRQGRRA